MAEKHITNLKIYTASKESLWFWVSLAFIFAFFTFSFITSENVFILFIKRASALIFAFLIPGYLITKSIYPKKNEIDVIERFAFSVAFSIAFIMLIGYVLNYFWEITHFSFAVTTFSVVLCFVSTAFLRDFHSREQKSNDIELRDKMGSILPLLLLCTLFFIIQSYPSLTNFNLRQWDPHSWAWTIARFLSTEHVDLLAEGGYPIGFPLIIMFLSIFLDVRPYEIIRFIPIFSFLNIVPVYLLANRIFKSNQISLLSAVLFFSTRWGFMRNSIGHPETFVHFFLILSLLMLLKTIEKPTTKNALITSLLFTSTVLEYHMPLQFLSILLPFIFVFSILNAYFNKKSRIEVQETVKLAALIGIPLIILSGLLWYFWQIDSILRYLQRDVIYLYQRKEVVDYHIFNIINGTVFNIGWLQTVFSSLGLIFLLRNPESRGELRYQFLVIYFFILLLLSNVNYLGIKYFNTKYMFAYLILPVSLLSSYGFHRIFEKYILTKIPQRANALGFSRRDEASSSDIRSRVQTPAYSHRGAFALIIIFMLLVNFNGFNYFWVYGKTADSELDKKVLVNKLNNGEYSSLFFYQFRYDVVRNLSIHEFQALKWLQKNTPLNSAVIGWGSYEWNTLKSVSERNVVVLYSKDMIDIPTSNSEQISKKIHSMRYFQGRNTYIVVGLQVGFEQGSFYKDKGPPFSRELEASIAQDPNFKLVYENPPVKIYKSEL